MKKLLEILFSGALIVAVILYLVWVLYFAPIRAENIARHEAADAATGAASEICSRAAHGAVFAAEKNRTPHFLGVDVKAGRVQKIRDYEYVVSISAYVLTLSQPDSLFREPSNILSCRIFNGQLIDSQWIR